MSVGSLVGCATQGEKSVVVTHVTTADGLSTICGAVTGAKAETQVDGAQVGALVGAATRAAVAGPLASPEGGFGAVSAPGKDVGGVSEAQPSQPLTTEGIRVTYDVGGCKVEIFRATQ